MNDRPRLKLNDQLSVEVVDPHNIQPVYVDTVTEIRVVGDTVYLSFANMIVEGTDPMGTKVQVCARIRVPRGLISFVDQFLASPPGVINMRNQIIN